MTQQRIKHVSLQIKVWSQRADFWAKILALEPSIMLWVDESGCDQRNALRKYGYGIRGHPPPQEHTLIFRGKRYSAIVILSTEGVEGVEDVYITDGTVDGDKFLEFLWQNLLPLLMPFNGQNPNSIVILDDASINHVDQVVELITSVGALHGQVSTPWHEPHREAVRWDQAVFAS